MPEFPDEPLDNVRRRLLDGMIEYMEPDEEEPDDDWDCGYTERDVERCGTIVDDYLTAIDELDGRSQEAIAAEIRKVVLALNGLNRDCDGGLIETDQREDLCQIILVAAKQAGLSSDEDVTEEWREW